jgi:hypothetical protein
MQLSEIQHRIVNERDLTFFKDNPDRWFHIRKAHPLEARELAKERGGHKPGHKFFAYVKLHHRLPDGLVISRDYLLIPDALDAEVVVAAWLKDTTNPILH